MAKLRRQRPVAKMINLYNKTLGREEYPAKRGAMTAAVDKEPDDSPAIFIIKKLRDKTIGRVKADIR
jgi:hypothetical protein